MKSQVMLLLLLLSSTLAVSFTILPSSAVTGDIASPYSLSQGSQSFNLAGNVDYIYFRFYGSQNMMYQFTVDSPASYSVTFYTNDTSYDQLDYLSSLYFLPSSLYLFGQSNYTLRVSTDYIASSVTITITELAIPVGATPSTAKTATTGDISGQLPYGDLPIYYKLSTTIGQWYQMTLTGDRGVYLSIDENSTGSYNGDGSYSGIAYAPFKASQSTTYIQLQSSDDTTDFVLNIIAISIPPHASFDTAKQANLGENNGEIYEHNVSFYFNLTTQVDQWYEIYLDIPSASSFSIDYSQLGLGYDYSYNGPLLTAFKADFTTTTFTIYGDGAVGPFTLKLKEITPLEHYLSSDPKSVSLGSNTGELRYESYYYYLNLTTTIGQWYELALMGPAQSNFDVAYQTSTSYGYTFTRSSLKSNPQKTAFQAGFDSTLIRVSQENETSGSFTLDIAKISTIDHTASQDAQIATIGINTGTTRYEDVPYVFNLTTVPGHWYTLNGTGPENSIMSFDLESASTSPFLYNYDNTPFEAFKAVDSAYQISITTEKQIGAFTMDIHEYSNVQHDDSLDAAQFLAGDNSGSTPDANIPFYFSFTTEVGQWYRFNTTMVNPDAENDYNLQVVSGPDFYGTFFGIQGIDYLLGDGSTIIVKVESTGASGDFNTNITMITPDNYNVDTAQTTSEGSHTYNFKYAALPQFYEFTAKPGSYYKVEVKSDNPLDFHYVEAYLANGSYADSFAGTLSSLIVTGQSSYYFGVMLINNNYDFDLSIIEIDYPKTLVFNQLQSGDSINWQVTTQVKSDFQDFLDVFGVPIDNGSFSLTSNNNQPHLDRSGVYWGEEVVNNTSFSLSNLANDFYPIVRLLLPTEISGDSSISMLDYFSISGFFGSNVQVQESSTEYHVTSELNFLIPFVGDWTFDIATGILLNQTISLVIEGVNYYTQSVIYQSSPLLTINSSHSVSQSTDTGKPGLLAMQFWSFMLGIIVVPVIVRRQR